ncbi:class I SAM-dependent methyltransferase [Roseovarius aestuarii]|uniref:Demethylrebeccamycin-D-glucose O-methyltransferase n=1 Tax=Roseovarius aestuarii TaxID=475083 RepID=A0A1X7BWT6_9RHOB|nr:class I SAM-dependent methyltransferase [Roseovarius aestuarii]SMC14112.1 Demethylrebeccamycin-D-glucose O-methyltransferase [Roseovarius aestuarii]
MDYDKTNVPDSYDAGREISVASKFKQLEFFVKNIPAEDIASIVDLGCGTGRYTSVLAEAFEATVVGVDPSKKMLHQARSKSTSGKTSFEHASGEAIPLDDGSTDLVYLSMVLHHLTSLRGTAIECARILRDNGRVCIRNTVADEVSSYPYLDIFPSIGSIIQEQLYSRLELINEFKTAGFVLTAHQTVYSEISPNWEKFAEKIALRADSFVSQLEDSEFEAGLSLLRAKAETLGSGERVGLNVDSFIFQKT